MPTDAPEPARADDSAAPGAPADDPAAAPGRSSGGSALPRPGGASEDMRRLETVGEPGGTEPSEAAGAASGVAGPPDGSEPPDSAGRRPGTAAGGGLSARDEAVLAMERRPWPGPGAKERAIREQLALSPTRYYQLLSALLDDPAALAHDPVTVNRLRRVRQAHRDAR